MNRRALHGGAVASGLAAYRRPFFLLGASLALGLAGPQFITFALLGLAALSLAGPFRAIEALTLSWLLGHLNPGLFGTADPSQLIRWLVLGCAFLSAVAASVYRDIAISAGVVAVTCYCLFVGSLSLLASYDPTLSLFKVASFFVGSTGVILAFDFVGRWHRAEIYLVALFEALCVAVVLSSIVIVAQPVGYYLNGQNFQGVLNHSQSFGTFVGVMLSWYFGRIIFDGHRHPLAIVVGAVGLVSLVAAGARTGAVALVFGLALTFAVALVFRQDWLVRFAHATSGGYVAVGLAAATVILLVLAQPLYEVAREFMFKRDAEASIGAAFYDSRGKLLAMSWENFRQHPLLGIGFGLPSDPGDLHVAVDPILGLPIGAPIEKGFLALAVLEETGIAGAVALLGVIVALALPVIRHGTASQFWLFGACLGVNFGESVLLSFGGHGLFVWLMLCLARALSLQQKK